MPLLYFQLVIFKFDYFPFFFSFQVLSSGKLNFQIQYQLTFCLWVMTFNNAIAEKMNK